MDPTNKANLRSAVQKNQKKDNHRLTLKAAEAELAATIERNKNRVAKRKTPARFDLSPLDQAFRLSLDPEYRRRWNAQEEMLTGRAQDIEASRRVREDWQRDYPELVAPVPPARLADLVRETEKGTEPLRETEEGVDPRAADAFFSAPVKVLRTFDSSTHPDFDSDKERVPEPHYVKEIPEPNDLPPGENPVFTFFYDADLLQGRFLHLQLDLSATKETILAQIKAVVDAAREVVKRGETRQKDLGKERRDFIRAALRLKTDSPRSIAAEVRPDLYEKKLAEEMEQNKKDRGALELRVIRTLKAARSMNIPV